MAIIVDLTDQDNRPVWVNFDNVANFRPNGNSGSRIVFTATETDAAGGQKLADLLVNESPELVMNNLKVSSGSGGKPGGAV